MRDLDKPDEQPALGKPINRKPPPEPAKHKVSDNVSEIAGRMFTEIAKNVAAPPEQQPEKPSTSTTEGEDWGICCTAVGWFVKHNRSNP